MESETVVQILREITKENWSDNLFWLIVTIVFGGLAAFLGAYLSKKGDMRALKEDIQEVETLTQEVKTRYNLILEQLADVRALKVLAPELRLHKYQEAYTLWDDMFWSIHDADLYEKAKKCECWWKKNCVYLDADTRVAFKKGINFATLHPDLLKARGTARDAERVSENWDRVLEVEKKIFENTELPGMRSAEINTDLTKRVVDGKIEQIDAQEKKTIEPE
ncbi:hypothetical protein QEH59_18190 [Coraliomargarita sp. SDUM461004]|uniref:DUF4760 domain-containing protein n=1 Tax=Thalassobacterium sedimentorum TaxID=3041258 RepID=A0ABU1ANJ4_9BACT|nr:hypothetical protein [Coraliomargarita sp. SDUM461004]MDQ8196366.1 hypothetical protein [Coraliomargarita sp. SDUM461004]